MKHRIALVSTVGLITFCIFNVLHQQTRTVCMIPSEATISYENKSPLKKTKEETHNVYVNTRTKIIASSDKDKTTDGRVQKESSAPNTKASAGFYSKSDDFVAGSVKKAIHLFHDLLR